MNRLVTFDAAGTLIEMQSDVCTVVLDEAKKIGLVIDTKKGQSSFKHSYEKYRNDQVEAEIRRDSNEIISVWQKMAADWLTTLGEDPTACRELVERVRDSLISRQSVVWRLYDDVLPTMETLKRRGFVIGVISNWDHTLHYVLEHLGLTKHLDFAIASLEFGKEKPHPDIFNEALKRSGAFNKPLHIGDDWEDDYRGAIEAGWDALLIDRKQPSDHSQNRIQKLNEVLDLSLC